MMLTLAIDFELPLEEWTESDVAKVLESIALMASDQVERWEGALTFHGAAISTPEGQLLVGCRR